MDFPYSTRKQQSFKKVGWKGVGTRYLDNYLYWFRWLELGINLAFDIKLFVGIVYK